MKKRKIVVKTLLFGVLLIMTGCTETKPPSSETTLYKTYQVQKVREPIKIDADWDKPVWQAIEPITLELYMGNQPEHKPRTMVKLAWDDEHVYVIFRVEDRYVRAVATEYFGSVCKDSCVEFFFTPQQDTAEGYFNLETNCIGTILMFHQQARNQGKRILEIADLDNIHLATSLPKNKPIDLEITEPTVWTLEYALPWRMLKNYTNTAGPAADVKWRANFYKCADETSRPHWLTWSKIPLDKPDFHQPRYFGYLEFVK